ncbi:MAG: ABC transporter permease [Candidatus Spechtbacterales bacterium]
MRLFKTIVHYSKRARRSLIAEAIKETWRDPLGKGAIFMLVFFAGLFVLSFWAPYDYRVQDLEATRQGVSAGHWFGTDLLGRDMFTRVLYATRPTLILLMMTVFLGGSALAIILGTWPIFYSKKADFFVQRTSEAIGGMPALFIIIILTAILRPLYDDFIYESSALGEWVVKTGLADLGLIMFVTALIGWVGPARMYRSMVLQLREAPFVERARMLGASRTRILFRHVIPQLFPYITHATLSTLAGVIGTEIALSFLGIGIRAPHPSFGAMFSESASARLLSSAPHMLLFPALVVSLFLLGLRILDIRSTVIIRKKQSGEV